MMTNGSVKQLRRVRDGKVIAGVCAGVGRYLGVDPNILRVTLAIASLFGGLGIGIYIVAWLLIPDQSKDKSIVHDLVDKNKDNPAWQDARAKAEQGWAKATNQFNQHRKPHSAPSDPYAEHPYNQPKVNDKD